MSMYSSAEVHLEKRYAYKITGMRPANLLVYFPQWEGAGAVSFDQSGNGWDGAYVGVTLGQTGIPKSPETCPLFDGANDYDNIWTAGFQGAFNGAEGTLFAWARVFNVGVWTDGASRYIASLRADANNRLMIFKSNINNRLTYFYEAATVVEQVDLGGLSTTDWFSVALTWSAAADEVRAYYNGVQTGAIQVGLGVWAGNLAAGSTVVGASLIVPANVWNGYIQHAAVWDTPLTPAEIAYLSVWR